MALVYITGVSATGKTSVLHSLAARGFKTYDEDDDELSSWYEKSSGRKTDRPAYKSDRTVQWYASHEWRMSRDRVERVAQDAKGSLTFLCGSTFSDAQMRDLFDTIICLTIDEDTLRHRLESRATSGWGRSTVEMKHVLDWREPWENIHRDHGAVIINATQPLPDVVDQVLKCVLKRTELNDATLSEDIPSI